MDIRGPDGLDERAVGGGGVPLNDEGYEGYRGVLYPSAARPDSFKFREG